MDVRRFLWFRALNQPTKHKTGIIFKRHQAKMTREKIIQYINKVTDQSILNDIERLIQLNDHEQPFKTSVNQKTRIQNAQYEIDSGSTFTSTVADTEAEQWLEK